MKAIAIVAATGCCLYLYAICIYFLMREFGIMPSSYSTLPAVIHAAADCDILRGVDQGHRYYVADCGPDRLSRRGAME